MKQEVDSGDFFIIVLESERSRTDLAEQLSP